MLYVEDDHIEEMKEFIGGEILVIVGEYWR